MGDTQNLIVTIYYRGTDDSLDCLNIDNFAKESNDHVFFRRVMLNLCSLDIMRRLPSGDRPKWISFLVGRGPESSCGSVVVMPYRTTMFHRSNLLAL
jgi:hypothetical protein